VRVRVAAGGRLEIGDHAFIDEGVVLQVSAGGHLAIGPSCFVGHHCTLAAEGSVSIGTGTFLAEMVSVRDHDHVVGAPPSRGGLISSAVDIGEDVWIGSKATVLRGVEIGDGAVIGAHSLVRSAVPPRHLAVGAPATVRRPLVERAPNIRHEL
jgi:acetyltransferase-like isoleucine patch superfamily enzyme